jgi:hypothetical protein
MSCKIFFAIGCVTDFLNINYAQQIQNNTLPNCSMPWLISLLGIKYPKQEIVCSPDDESNLGQYFDDTDKYVHIKRMSATMQYYIIHWTTSTNRPLYQTYL